MRMYYYSHDMYKYYVEACNTKTSVILTEDEFAEFLMDIDILNNNIDKDADAVHFNDGTVKLTEIPFDNRLAPLLTPMSVTVDVYTTTQRDFLERETINGDSLKNFSYQRFIKLQDKFFNAFKGRELNRSNSLAENKIRVTLNQINDACFESDLCWTLKRNGVWVTPVEEGNLFKTNPELRMKFMEDDNFIFEVMEGKDKAIYTKAWYYEAVRSNLTKAFGDNLRAPVPVAAVPMDDTKLVCRSVRFTCELLMEQICLDIKNNN